MKRLVHLRPSNRWFKNLVMGAIAVLSALGAAYCAWQGARTWGCGTAASTAWALTAAWAAEFIVFKAVTCCFFTTIFATDDFDHALTCLQELTTDTDEAATASELADAAELVCAFVKLLGWKSPRAVGPHVDIEQCAAALRSLPPQADLSSPEVEAYGLMLYQWLKLDYEIDLKPWRNPIVLDWMTIVQRLFFATLPLVLLAWICAFIARFV